MTQKQSILTVGRTWDFLEAAMYPELTRTDHAVLLKPTPGNTLIYPKGQVICQKNDGSNEWAKMGTAGYTKSVRLIRTTIIVDENGNWQYGSSWQLGTAQVFSDSVPVIINGFFFTQDLVGLVGSGGTNEVQTETVTASGGNRTLTITNPLTGVSETTTALNYNANIATIQAAINNLDNVEPGDIVVSGSYVYTFGGRFAGLDVPLIVVNTGGLTGGSSSIAVTTPGVDNSAKVGRLIRGTVLNGIIELGAAQLN